MLGNTGSSLSLTFPHHSNESPVLRPVTPIRAVRRDPDVPEDTPGRGDVQHLAHEARKHVGRQDEEKGEGERGNGQDDERCRRLEQGCAQKDEPARGGEDPVGRSKSPACGHFKIPHLKRV